MSAPVRIRNTATQPSSFTELHENSNKLRLTPGVLGLFHVLVVEWILELQYVTK